MDVRKSGCKEMTGGMDRRLAGLMDDEWLDWMNRQMMDD